MIRSNSSVKVAVTKVENAIGSTDKTENPFIDSLAVEEPLEIRLDYVDDLSTGHRKQKSVSITMRTPGADPELAVGFLFTEGLIQNRDDVINVAHCGPKLAHLGQSNVIKVQLAPSEGVLRRLKNLDRNFYTTSSCGVCGKSSIEALKTLNQYNCRIFDTAETRSADPTSRRFTVARKLLSTLPEKLREGQAVFDRTGGLHASGLFSSSGQLLTIQEDVGRHNALDKLIGDAYLRNRLPLSNAILMLSGRISFELVQKASMAGLKFIAAVGAPSSLAVELAHEMDMTMVGFLRGPSFNLYCGERRLV